MLNGKQNRQCLSLTKNNVNYYDYILHDLFNKIKWSRTFYIIIRIEHHIFYLYLVNRSKYNQLAGFFVRNPGKVK